MIASWGIAAGWIAFEITVPPHRTEELLWRASVALGLVAAASCLLVIWFLTGALVEPANSQSTTFRVAYRSGYLDGEAGRKPAHLYLLPLPRTEDGRGTGTH